MRHLLLLAVAILSFADEAHSLTRIAYDPYATVSWTEDVRCKTAFHSHTDTMQSRIQAYDDAGYCAVSFHHYSGVPLHTTAWKQLHWPPEQWLNPSFLASLRNIRVLIPDGEQVGWDHIDSPFLTSYLECYRDANSRYANSLCRQPEDPREPHHYSNEKQLVDRIHQFGGLATIAHNIAPPTFHVLDRLPADLMEICSSMAEYSEWQCEQEGGCTSWNDGPQRMLLHYDEKLRSTPRIWGICVNDWHGPGSYNAWNPPGPAWINDSGHTLVLAPRVDLPTLKQRVGAGAMLAVQDRGLPKGAYPQVQRIDVGSNTIHVEATGYTSILWIHNGTLVGALPDLDVSWLTPGTVRAELRDAQGSVVFTQPWELSAWTPQCSDGADNDGDGHVDHPADPECTSPLVDLEGYGGQCDDHYDNDGDGFVDLADSDCESLLDDREFPPPVCNDGLDNDADGWIDYPADEGCSDPLSFSEGPACSNGVDEDGDGLFDADDPDCFDATDPWEGPLPMCANGDDDDGDGLIDYPDDTGCPNVFGGSESPQCDDDLDNDGDGLFDVADPDCASASDPIETPPPPACRNGIDDDGDGLIDYPIDRGCARADDDIENPACDDELDNDGDGGVDWDGGASHAMPDRHCKTASRSYEGRGCGLGVELAALLPVLFAARRRSRRAVR